MFYVSYSAETYLVTNDRGYCDVYNGMNIVKVIQYKNDVVVSEVKCNNNRILTVYGYE